MQSALLRAAIAAVLAALAALALAQSAYPTKPVRLIVPFPPGGSNDIVGRVVGAELSDRFGRQVVIDNRAGAGGVVGSEIAARAEPDGHTLLVISVAYAFNPALYTLRFDPKTAFTAVAMLGNGPNALVVNPKQPVNSVKALIALAKAKPGQLNYATAGVGTFQHLGSELFRRMAGINVVHVPFKGGGPAMADVIAGNTQFCLGSLIQVMPHITSNRLKVLAIGGVNRTAALPNVPTIAEAGVPGYDASNWWGVLAPAATPTAIVTRLNDEIGKIMRSPEMQKRFESQGAETATMTPADFSRYIRIETAKWSKLVKESGIKAE